MKYFLMCVLLLSVFSNYGAEGAVYQGTYQAMGGPELRYVVATPTALKPKKRRSVWIFQPGDGSPGADKQFSFATSSIIGQIISLRENVIFIWPELRRQHLYSSDLRAFCELDFFHRVKDLNALIDSVKRLSFVDQSKIFIIGHSAGSEISTLTAIGRNDIKGVATYAGGVSSPGEFQEIDIKDPHFSFKCDDPVYYESRSGVFWRQLFFEAKLNENIRKVPVPYLALLGSKDEVDLDRQAFLASMIAANKPDFSFKVLNGQTHSLGLGMTVWDEIATWSNSKADQRSSQ
jgi:pimeloyl-ACP methyl ester carboxylesterase